MIQQQQYQSNSTWLDVRLSKEAMGHLWEMIESPIKDAKGALAGEISKSDFIPDKDNWFYKNALKELCDTLYCKDWDNYYQVVVTNSRPLPTFELDKLWVNYQKQHEFQPSHSHSGVFSFVVFMKIPTHWKEQHALPFVANSRPPIFTSNFAFIDIDYFTYQESNNIRLSPEDEGRMLFFPAWLKHQVFPFYECEEERITISGNIMPAEGEKKRKNRLGHL